MDAELGEEPASRLAQRLQELQALDCLADVGMLPGADVRRAEGNPTDCVSVRIGEHQRLMLRPFNEQVGAEWNRVTKMVVLGMVEEEESDAS